MIHFPRWKIALIVLVCLFGVAYAAPNLMSKAATDKMQKNLPGWMPGKTVNLGLDLEGGSYLLYDVDTDSVISERLDDLLYSYKIALKQNKDENGEIARIDFDRDSEQVKENGFSLRLLHPEQDREKAYSIARGLEEGLEVATADDGFVTVKFSPSKLVEIKSEAINRSIEVVRYRIDETGTRDPVVARQGEKRFLVLLPGIDDPEPIKEIIDQPGTMSFHLVNTDVSPDALRIPANSVALPMRESDTTNK